MTLVVIISFIVLAPDFEFWGGLFEHCSKPRYIEYCKVVHYLVFFTFYLYFYVPWQKQQEERDEQMIHSEVNFHKMIWISGIFWRENSFCLEITIKISSWSKSERSRCHYFMWKLLKLLNILQIQSNSVITIMVITNSCL